MTALVIREGREGKAWAWVSICIWRIIWRHGCTGLLETPHCHGTVWVRNLWTQKEERSNVTISLAYMAGMAFSETTYCHWQTSYPAKIHAETVRRRHFGLYAGNDIVKVPASMFVVVEERFSRSKGSLQVRWWDSGYLLQRSPIGTFTLCKEEWVPTLGYQRNKEDIFFKII